jgi:hypothetical protein
MPGGLEALARGRTLAAPECDDAVVARRTYKPEPLRRSDVAYFVGRIMACLEAIDPTSDTCLRWEGRSCDSEGYARIMVRYKDGSRRPVNVARITDAVTHGSVPRGGVVRHRCGCPPC